MLENFLIVNKEVLPDVFHKVVEVKQMMDAGEYTQVSEAVKKVGISRSAFYKYKDHVFVPSSTTVLERKALISFVLSDEKGILSEVLNTISNFGCNVLTINQNIPIQKKASVIMSIDIKEMKDEIHELLRLLNTIKGVSKVTLMSIE